MLASLWEPLSLAPRRRRPPRRPHAMWRHQSSRGDRGVPRRRFAKPVRGAECDSHAAGKARGPGGEYVPEPKQPPRLGLRRSRAVSRLKPSRRGEHVCPPQPWRMKYGRRFGFCGCGAPACSSPSRSTWLVASGSPRVRLRRSADAGRICGATSVTGTGRLTGGFRPPRVYARQETSGDCRRPLRKVRSSPRMGPSRGLLPRPYGLRCRVPPGAGTGKVFPGAADPRPLGSGPSVGSGSHPARRSGLRKPHPLCRPSERGLLEAIDSTHRTDVKSGSVRVRSLQRLANSGSPPRPATSGLPRALMVVWRLRSSRAIRVVSDPINL